MLTLILSTAFTSSAGTGYSWMEEELAQRMSEHVIPDGKLITGQNPMSQNGVGEHCSSWVSSTLGNTAHFRPR